ncbi:MAG: hypothetical protein HFE47_07355 [Clostridia bacterium]|nr:hypothetical protein [Clostridia bacterium]
MSITVIKFVCVAVLSYLLGNFNSAICISKLKKRDIRKLGSGNPGTMNMFRNFGKGIGLLTLALDALKGVIPCLAGWFVCGEAWQLGGNKIGLYVGAVGVIIGHIFPVFYKFKGGKGIASSVGICLVLNWWATLISFTVGALFLIFFKVGSITSFIIISFPIALDAFTLTAQGGHVACLILLFALFCLTLFAHTKNVCKLFAGTERQVVLFKKKEKAGTSRSKG